MKTLIARWEVKGGKRALDLFKEDFKGRPSYDYKGDHVSGNIGWKDTDQEAIDSLKLTLECFKMDFPSLHRVQ